MADKDLTKHYYKKKLVNNTIEVEYSSETDMIDITIEQKLVMGANIGYERMKIHPSYIEPLYKMLKEVSEPLSNTLKGEDKIDE